MNPENALAILDQVVSKIDGSRQFHMQLQQAIECLRGVISKPDVEEQPVAEPEE